MNRAAPRSRFRVPALPGAFILALLVGAWVLPLGFRGDDFVQIPGAYERLRFECFLGESRAHVEGPLFRPLLWATFALDACWNGRPMKAWPSLLVGLLLHAAVSVLILSLARRAGCGRGAWIAWLLYTLAAPAPQALSWIAARYALLQALCSVAAVHLLLGAPRPRRFAAVGGLAALGIATQIGGIPLGAALGLAGLVRLARGGLRSGRRSALAAFLLVLPIVLVLAWRGAHTARFEGLYLSGITLDADGLSRLPRAVPTFLRQLAVPWNTTPLTSDDALLRRLLEGQGSGEVREGLAILIGAAVLGGVACLPSRQRRTALLTLLAGGVASAPGVFLLGLQPAPSDASRVFLVPLLAWAVHVALAWAGWRRAEARGPGARWTARIGCAAILLHLALSADALAGEARRAWRLQADCDEALATVWRTVEESPEEVAFLVRGMQPYVEGHPSLSAYFVLGVRPPFSAGEVEALVAEDWAPVLEFSPELDRAVALAEFEGMRLRVARILPGYPEGRSPAPEMRPLRTSARSGGTEWAVVPPASPRHRPVVVLPFGPGPERTVDVEFALDTGPLARTVHLGASRDERRVRLSLRAEAEWFLAAAIRRIAVVSRDGGPGLTAPPRLLPASAGTITVTAPLQGFEVPPGGPMPTLRFSAPPSGCQVRLRTRFNGLDGLACTTTAASGSLLRSDEASGFRVWRPAARDETTSAIAPLAGPWEELPARAAFLVGQRGPPEVRVALKVEFVRDGRVEAESAWVRGRMRLR